MAVGPDGTLLVAYGISPATGPYSLNVQKFTSCASWSSSQTARPYRSSKAVNGVSEMAGLDRPAQGNYAPAYDSGTTGRIFIVYSNEATPGNDDIHVVESRDNGATWPLDAIVSTNANGRKYLPWACSTAGKTFRDLVPTRRASAGRTRTSRPTIVRRCSTMRRRHRSGSVPEINASGVNDAQCAPGFPGSVPNSLEQTLCNNLPPGFIQGGTCQLATCPAAPAPCVSTAAACRLRAATPCATAGEVCTARRRDPEIRRLQRRGVRPGHVVRGVELGNAAAGADLSRGRTAVGERRAVLFGLPLRRCVCADRGGLHRQRRRLLWRPGSTRPAAVPGSTAGVKAAAAFRQLQCTPGRRMWGQDATGCR